MLHAGGLAGTWVFKVLKKPAPANHREMAAEYAISGRYANMESGKEGHADLGAGVVLQGTCFRDRELLVGGRAGQEEANGARP